jgi:hypothetical protein
MDPQLLLALLPLLMGGGSSGGGGNPLSLLGLGGGSNPLSGLLGLFGGSNPLSSLFGGVPNTQKTLGVESGLAKSGDPISQMLADYVKNGVLGQGNVLSSPGGAGFGKMAQILEWLSGGSLPGLSDKGGSSTADIGGVSGIPVPRDISRLNQMLGMSPNMDPAQIEAFLPQLESLISGGGHLKSLAGQAEALINSVSGQKKAGLGGGGNTANNPLAALMGGGGGGGSDPSAINQLLAHFKSMSGGNSGNLVGASA